MSSEKSAIPRKGILTRFTPEDQGHVELPALAPHLQSRVVGEAQALLVSERFNTLLHGELHCNLLPLLDGQHTRDEIVARLEKAHLATDVLAAIGSLSAKGYVVSADHGMERSRAAYWSSLGASPRWAERQLSEACVAVEDDDGQLSRQLVEQGARVANRSPRLRAIVCDDFLASNLGEANRRQLEAGTPWILARPRGMEALFGPVFRADGHGPCWDCLAHRLRGHQEVHNFLRNVAGEKAAFTPFAIQPAVLEALYALIAAEIVKWLVLEDSAPLHECAIVMDVGTLAVSQHRVVRRPQCLACGNEASYRPDRSPRPLCLQPSPKAHRGSGGARSVAPEVTLAKYGHLVSPVSGVVTWLSRTSDENDSWLHVDWAGSNLGMRSRTLSSLRRSLRSKSAGKGSTREQSSVSALCEAIERHSGTCQGDEIRVRGRFADFIGDEEAIHPNDVQLFSDSQLDDATRINAKGHPYNIVPPRLDPDAEIDWTPVWSFTQRRHRLLPTSILYSMAPEQRGPMDLIADSNGCAAGNTLEEAILQGFHELAERDAFAIWWYNRLQVPAVDLGSFGDAFLAAASGYYARLGREIWMLDITADIK
ncbi:MAG: TOMM precursor leader peptide-binding protein, partial [Boseongicola sp. SB0664_bin_43]|nr:TOMM precursor leader peptide-binding protein [Boseongicola sp. SB0664_bin_43]